MLTVFSILLGYNLKVALGTSTMIMTGVALVGTASHLALGAELFLAPMSFIVIICLIVAVSSARFANRCDILKLNRVIGIVLLILGLFTIFTKYYL